MPIKLPRDIAVIAALMILFGFAEIITGFTHRFLGIATASATTLTVDATVIGALYVAAGVLVLSMRRWAAGLAIVCLVLDVAGRISLVVAGLYPLDSPKQVVAIVMGTVIAAVFAVYIWSRRALFV